VAPESWAPKYPVELESVEKSQTSIVLSEPEQKLLELLKTKGLSIKNLDDGGRAELSEFLFTLHQERGLSLSDISLLIGNKTSGYTSWLCKQLGVPARPFEEARLKAIKEKRRKYERKPFGGTEEERAYLLGLRHGDLSVSRPWKGVVRVSTSTTHPAMAELFTRLFSPHGHVYRYPRYKKDTHSYEWNLQTILDGSFGFICSSVEECWTWVRESRERTFAYIAGVVDAEGHIGIFRNYKTIAIVISIFNTNRDFLVKIQTSLDEAGYRVLGPYLDKQRGTSGSKYQIVRKKDYWRIAVADFVQCQSLLSQLAIRHEEKLARKRLALTIQRGGEVGGCETADGGNKEQDT